MKQIYLFVAFTFTTFSFSQVPSLEWDRLYESNNAEMSFGALETDGLGNSYSIGLMNDTIFMSSNIGWNVLIGNNVNQYSNCIIKKDPDGEIIYYHYTNTSYPELLPLDDGTVIYSFVHSAVYGPISVDIDHSSGVQLEYLDSGEYRSYLQKYDWNGNLEWSITYSNQEDIHGKSVNHSGQGTIFRYLGTSDDINVSQIISSPIVLGSGNYLIEYDYDGNYLSHIDIDNMYPDYFEFADDGSLFMELILWADSVDVDLSSNTNLIHRDTNYLMDISEVIVKYDNQLNFEWVKRFSSFDISLWTKHFFRIDENSNLYVYGSFLDTLKIQDSGTGFNHHSTHGTNDYDIFLIKYDENGDLLNTNIVGGQGCDAAKDIEIDEWGSLYLLGDYCMDSINMDLNGGSNYLPYTSKSNGFIGEYDLNLNLKWVDNYSSTGHVLTGGLGTDYNGFLYVNFEVEFGDTMDFTPGPLSQPVYNTSEGKGIVLKYASDNLNVGEIGDSERNYILFPNPSNGQFNLKFEEQIDEIQIDIFSIQGQLIHSENHFQTNLIHSSFEAPKGIYLVKVSAGGIEKTLKMIVE